jgi:hypothetical protein
MILMHGLIMNGGVHHALDFLSEAEVEAAISGYEYFEVASALTAIQTVLNDSSLRDWNDSNESKANMLYYDVIPDDAVLVAAFNRRFAMSPGDFDKA